MPREAISRQPGSKAGQEYEDRRQYIRHHAADMELIALAGGFFARFDLMNKSAASDALHSSLMATANDHIAKKMKVRVNAFTCL